MALNKARNFPSHAMSLIARYVYWKMENKHFPYHTEPGQVIHIKDMLCVETDLKVLLIVNDIDSRPLKVGMRDGDICVTFKNLDDVTFLKDLNHRDALRIVYTT